MPTLYEIDSAIMDCVDSDTGEIINEDKLNALLMERSEKLEGVALWIKNLESLVTALKVEEETLKKRREMTSKKVESLKNWLSAAADYQKFETSRVAVSFRRSEQTIVDESVIDKKWLKEKVTYTPDKSAIKAAIKAGQTVAGAKIVVNQNIQIK